MNWWIDEKDSVRVLILFSYQNACREDRSRWNLWEADLSKIVQSLPAQ